MADKQCCNSRDAERSDYPAAQLREWIVREIGSELIWLMNYYYYFKIGQVRLVLVVSAPRRGAGILKVMYRWWKGLSEEKWSRLTLSDASNHWWSCKWRWTNSESTIRGVVNNVMKQRIKMFAKASSRSDEDAFCHKNKWPSGRRKKNDCSFL